MNSLQNTSILVTISIVWNPTPCPIFSDFGELLEGIVTVQVFSAERQFLNNLHLKIDNTMKMWYSFWMTTTSSTATEVDTKTTLGLDTQVSGGGMNFSQGQRQLIAMVRALLCQSSIIVLNEAMSNIDFATNAKIQTAIHRSLQSHYS
ncbi:hypothetical protein BDQ17DRAFT_1332906 [Cyathus striatus]|nr:hypothetical protein BDQ17DRAFT_1332906 [Cyathus striatus]